MLKMVLHRSLISVTAVDRKIRAETWEVWKIFIGKGVPSLIPSNIYTNNYPWHEKKKKKLFKVEVFAYQTYKLFAKHLDA